MKHIIILGDGMADHPVERLGGKTLLQYANKPYMDMLAKMGRTGRLITIPDGFNPGSEVANTAILGYDLNRVYEGRGPLEAASIGYEMQKDDFAMRCNIVALKNEIIINHHGGHLTTHEGEMLIAYLNRCLGNRQIKFVTGIQYRHLLIIRGGNKHIICNPPHDHPDESWKELMVISEPGWEERHDGNRMTGNETAELLNRIILKSQEFLESHPFNIGRVINGKDEANSIWPWGGGYRPEIEKLSNLYPHIRNGSVISAVDLIRGIGHYAGLKIIKVEGATGFADTNYEGKAEAALKALKNDDFVFLHLEASDEAGHDGDLELKLKTIEYLDNRIIKPIYEEIKTWKDNPVCMAILPDHPTPVEVRTHVNEPVPFIIWHNEITPDEVETYDEVSCARGHYGILRSNEFMKIFMEY